jgi:hypothetical protein
MRMFVTRLALALAVLSILWSQSMRAQTPVAEANQKVPKQQDAAQTPPPEGNPAVQDQVLPESTTDALRGLATLLQDKRADLAKATDENEKRKLEKEILDLRWQFASMVTRIDVKKFEDSTVTKFDLQGEVIDALRPVVTLLKGATEGLSAKLELDDAITATTRRRDDAWKAIVALRRTKTQLRQPPVSPKDELAAKEVDRELIEHWEPLHRDLQNQLPVLIERQNQMSEAEVSLWTTIVEKLDQAVKSSGLSIVLCVGAFLATFFGLRFLSNIVLRRKRDRGFTARLAEVLLSILTLVAAIAATLIVMYVRGELVMLTIGIIFVIGAGWLIAKSAPMFLEQIRLILNIGSVREGERLIIEGLPYRVEALRFYSKLKNPALTGGTLRVPIGMLIGQSSRLGGPEEPWFPCQQGDVVVIEDLIGIVELQTPETVVFVNRKDAPRCIPTPAFLAMNPRNLSRGFLLTVTFGIDYSHQADVLQRIPQLFEAAVRERLASDPDGDALVNLKIELSTAGASSLDLLVLANFTGKAAIRHNPLKRAINQALVAACTEHGFGIPFPQLQVHGVGETRTS